MKTKRIAVFQSHWALQAHTVLLVHYLAQNGFTVDLFLIDCPQFYPVDDLKQHPNVRVIDCGSLRKEEVKKGQVSKLGNLTHPIKKALKAAYGFLGLDFSPKTVEVITPLARQTIEEHLQSATYDWFIGVEKEGFLLAAEYASKQGKPYIYYSLELYTRNHPLVKNSPRWQAIHKLEASYLQTARTVVIQDENRAAVFRSDYGLPLVVDVVYIPISLEPSFYDLSATSAFAENEFDLIQLGVISKERFTFDLVDTVKRLMRERNLLIHGHGEDEDIRRLQTMIHSNNITTSLERVDAHQLPLVIKRAKIGLALYSPKTDNERLTIKSSEKIPLYLLCGKPVITFDHEGCDFLEQNRCGAVIHKLSDLPFAVEKILENYAEYSHNARICFDQYYRYEPNAQKLVEYVRSH
jgi:glycosyltransferase involved in cell wall biosynthesis